MFWNTNSLDQAGWPFIYGRQGEKRSRTVKRIRPLWEFNGGLGSNKRMRKKSFNIRGNLANSKSEILFTNTNLNQ